MGRVVNKADYTFNKVAKTITFSSTYTGIELSQIQLITDVTNTTIIYQFNKTGYGGTLAGLVLTLTYNTNTAGFNNTDDLMIIINESQDNTQLYSGTLSTTGASTAVLTTDQQTISIQISGTWEGIVNVEGSNDGTNYVPLMFYPVNEYALTDFIGQNGIFTLATATKYVRLNVQQLLTGSITALILGRTVNGPNAADVLSMAMDRTQRAPLIVEDINGSTGPLKKDSNNALVPSDWVFAGNFRSTDYLTVDTLGYNTVYYYFMAQGSGSFQFNAQGSFDGINWVTVSYRFWSSGNGSFNNPAAGTSGVGVNTWLTVGVFCSHRYIRIVAALISAGTIMIGQAYLRQNAFPEGAAGATGGVVTFANTAQPINISQVGGSSTTQGQAVTTGGGVTSIPGTLEVGGLQAPGSPSVPFPVVMGGRQSPTSTTLGGIVRTMLLDPDGRVQLATDQTKNTGTVQLQAISNNFQNGNSLSVTDLSQFEGQSQIEILGQILLELRILNQNFYELPNAQNLGKNTLNEPTEFRNEQSTFNT